MIIDYDEGKYPIIGIMEKYKIVANWRPSFYISDCTPWFTTYDDDTYPANPQFLPKDKILCRRSLEGGSEYFMVVIRLLNNKKLSIIDRIKRFIIRSEYVLHVSINKYTEKTIILPNQFDIFPIFKKGIVLQENV
jgi:hypothetical protein